MKKKFAATEGPLAQGDRCHGILGISGDPALHSIKVSEQDRVQFTHKQKAASSHEIWTILSQ